MTIRHLKIFIEVYKEMSVTKAAEKLHLAQPSVSLAIRELEEAYRVRLFDRINRRLYVTENGKLFFDYAVHIVSSFDQMESVMTSARGIGSIHIGSSITIASYLIPDAVRRFGQVCPECQVSVTVENSHRIIQKVLKNELDFGVVEDKSGYEQLEERPFMEDKLYFVCGSGHPLAGRETVTLEEICRYPFFMREPGSAAREITDHLMKSRQMKYHILWESVSNQVLLHGVEKLPGITVVSGRVLEKEQEADRIRILPFHPEAFCRQFMIVYHRQKFISRTMAELMQVIEESGSRPGGHADASARPLRQ